MLFLLVIVRVFSPCIFFYSAWGFPLVCICSVSTDLNQLLYVIVGFSPPALFSCRVSFSAFYKLPYFVPFMLIVCYIHGTVTSVFTINALYIQVCVMC